MLNEAIRNGLRNLFGYFRARLAVAQAQPEGQIEGYLLALTTLDALVFYESGKDSNAETFAYFVLQYSGLADTYNKVNIPLAAQYLSLRKPALFSTFAQWMHKTYGLDEHYKLRRIRSTDEDPDWPTFWERVRNSGLVLPANSKKQVRAFLYARLLRDQYRNHAVHRLSIRDEAANISGEAAPYYMNESAACTRFDCVRLGFSCWIARLVIYSDLGKLPSELIVEEIQNTLRSSEVGAPRDLQLEPHAQWDSTFSMWNGHLRVGASRYKWTLSTIFPRGWINFGIPRPYVLQTLANAIENLQKACESDLRLAARVWLRAQRRIV